MKNYYIYCHTNLINNKKYVGITCQKPIYRWGKNGRNYSLQPKFYNAIIKYGWNNFAHDILQSNLDFLEARDLEKEYIKNWNTIDNGYNISTGGGCQFTKQVRCITTDQVFNSVEEAANFANICGATLSRCLHGHQLTAGNINGIKLEWCFVIDEYNTDKINSETLRLKKQQDRIELANQYKALYLNGTTITEIANMYNTSKATVSKMLKEIGVEVIPSYIKVRKAVDMFDKDWNYIQTFQTSTEALAFFNMTDSNIGRLKRACEEPWRLFKGHHWKYTKESE